MNRLKVGIIGTGGIFYGWGGNSGHLPVYPRIVDEAQIVALCDANEANLRKAEYSLKKLFSEQAKTSEEQGELDRAKWLRDDANNVKCYTQLKKMLENEELGLVDIITPPIAHASIAIEALRSGVNVMCEKPMARTWLECQKIVSAVAETGKFYQHNEQLIYMPEWYGLRKFLDSRIIGEPLLTFLSSAIGDAKSIRWDANASGGGSLIDMGVHDICAIWFALGFEKKKPMKVKSVHPHGISIKMPKRLIKGTYQDVHVEDDAHIIIEFEDITDGSWATVNIEASWSYRDLRRNEIFGTNGSIAGIGVRRLELSDSFENKRQVELDMIRNDVTEAPIEEYSGWLGEIKNLCYCIKEGVKPICSEIIGSEVQAIIDSAYLSQLKGMRAVSLEEYKEYAKEVERKEGDKASDMLISEFMKAVYTL